MAPTEMTPRVGTTPAGALARAEAPGFRAAATTQLARYLGAASILAVGALHLQQYDADHYSAIPTIGTLFLLTFVGATVVGVALLAPLARAGRVGQALLGLAAVGGVGIAAGALGGLFISESVGLFGFSESGYREAILLSIATEALAGVLLAVFAHACLRRVLARSRHGA